MMDTNDTLIQLLKVTERLSTQMKTLDERLSKLESVMSNDIKQDQRLNSVEISLQRGNQKFINIEERLKALESLEGDKAKKMWNQIISYGLTTLLGFIVSAVVFYFTTLGAK